MAINQVTWNRLFTWITGEKCFLPEGCSPPASGIAVYGSIAALALILIVKRGEVVQKWKSWRK